MQIESQEHKAHASVVSSSEATIAVVSILIDGVTHNWTGTAKRTPGDKFSLEIGRKLALSRALQKASRQLERQANGLVKSAEDNRLQAERARKRGIPKRYRVINTQKRTKNKAKPVLTSEV